MDALFAILAGGRGTRLGGDKVSAELAGRPLIAYPLEAAASALGGVPPGSEGGLVVVAKPETKLPPAVDLMGVRVVREPAEPVHPLAGVVAALGEAGAPPGDQAPGAVVAVAADMPFVTPALLGWLAARPEPLVVPEVGGRLHPLLARYEWSLLARLEQALASEAPLQETVRSLDPATVTERELSRLGDPARLLFNVNTPRDLAVAAELLGGAGAAPAGD